MAAWTIRQAVAEDAPGLTVCMRAAYAEAAARLGDLPPLTADYADEIATCQVWVAMVDEEIVGGLVLVPGDDALQLANVAVVPHYAGRGLGKALIDHAELEAVAQGFQEIRLATHTDMGNNLALYRHLGWEQTGTEGATVYMKKDLSVNQQAAT
jgi:ribosomal protein S18 acetylase RimI-like enzyme